MLTKERIFKLGEIFAICIIFIAACFVGKSCMSYGSDRMTTFNLPAIAILLAGDILMRLAVRAIKAPAREKKNIVIETNSVFEAQDDLATVKTA